MRSLHLALAVALLSLSGGAQTSAAPADARHASPWSTTQHQAPAANPSAQPADHAAAPGAAQAGGMMTKGAAELKRLNFMVGTWKTTEKFEANEFIPKPGTGAGHAEIHEAPGHLFMIENYRSTNTLMGKFSGHAVMWYDDKAQQYKAFWCDSMGGCEASFGAGKWEGDKLIFTGDSEYQGKKIAMRQTFFNIKPDTFSWTEESSTDGGPMKPSMSIVYTRLSGPKTATKPDMKQ